MEIIQNLEVWRHPSRASTTKSSRVSEEMKKCVICTFLVSFENGFSNLQKVLLNITSLLNFSVR